MSLSSGLISFYDDLSRAGSHSWGTSHDEASFTGFNVMNNEIASFPATGLSNSDNTDRCQSVAGVAVVTGDTPDVASLGFGIKNTESDKFHFSVTMDCDDAVQNSPKTPKSPVHGSRTLRPDARSGLEDLGYSLSVTLSSSACLETDDRKRPLSVSSTSSSASSSSSLPRHVRKRIANMSSSGVAAVGSSSATGADDHSTFETLFTVAECSPADTHLCSNSSGQFFGKDVCMVSCGANDSVTADPRSRCASVDYSAASDADDSAGNSARSSFDGLMLDAVDDAENGMLTGAVYIARVVAEILETERNYVKDLSDIVQGYLDHMRKNAELELTSDDLDALFGNIEAIWSFNRHFLLKLERCSCDPIRIAGCFVSETDGFVIYSEYCTNYPRSMVTLTRCMMNPKIAAVLKEQQILLEHRLPLGSYLLKPVQRILKYHILLQNIFNNHDPSDEGHDVIEKALGSMTSVALHINEMKRQHEHAVRIQEVQSHLEGWDTGADLTTFGDLILEDRFRVCGAKAQRLLFLFEKAFLLTKEKDDGKLLVKRFILFSNLMVIESVPKEPLSFQVIPYNAPREQCTLQARNLEQKRLWCRWIKKLMLENYGSKIPEKAKELVMTLGRSREEEDFESSNAEIPELVKKQHNAPEYLEKRRGRRKSIGFTPELKVKPNKGTQRSGPLSAGDSNSLNREKTGTTNTRFTDAQPVTDDEGNPGANCDNENSTFNDSCGKSAADGTALDGGSSYDAQKSDSSFDSQNSINSVTSTSDRTKEANFGDRPSIVRGFSAADDAANSACTAFDAKILVNNGYTTGSCHEAYGKTPSLLSQSSACLTKPPESAAPSRGFAYRRSNSASTELRDIITSAFPSMVRNEGDFAASSFNRCYSHNCGDAGDRFAPAQDAPGLEPCLESSGVRLVHIAPGVISVQEAPVINSVKILPGAILVQPTTNNRQPRTAGSSVTEEDMFGNSWSKAIPCACPRSRSHGNINSLNTIASGEASRNKCQTAAFLPSQKSDNDWLEMKPADPRTHESEAPDGNEDGFLSPVRWALNRLSSRLPTNSLQNLNSVASTSGDTASEKSDSSSVRSENRKDVKSRFSRLLGRSPQNGHQRKGAKMMHASRSLADVLKGAQQGSSVIGERMAVSPDKSFDPIFTLADRSKHRRPGLLDRDDLRSSDSDPGFMYPGVSDEATDAKKTELAPLGEGHHHDDSTAIRTEFAETEGIGVEQIPEEDLTTGDSEFYYEDRLLQDLEDGDGEDDDCVDGEDDDCDDENDYKDIRLDDNDVKSAKPSASQTRLPVPQTTIKETLDVIERRSNSRHVRKVEVQLGEKAQGIQEILQTLENANRNSRDSSMVFGTLPNHLLQHRTFRDRTRELAVCAAITRIRQNNCNVVTSESTYSKYSVSVQEVGKDVNKSPELKNDESTRL